MGVEGGEADVAGFERWEPVRVMVWHEVVAWFTAELNFMDPRHGVTIVHGLTEKDDPQRYAQLLGEMARDTSAYDAAAENSVHHVINPVETREYLIRLLDVHRMRLTKGVGEHLMRTWPTSF